MIRKASDFYDFFVAKNLVDLFYPPGSDDIELVEKKIIYGLEACGIIDYKNIADVDILDKELIAS